MLPDMPRLNNSTSTSALLLVVLAVCSCQGDVTVAEKAAPPPKSTHELMSEWAEKYRESAQRLVGPLTAIRAVDVKAQPPVRACAELGDAIAVVRVELQTPVDAELGEHLRDALASLDAAASYCRSPEPQATKNAWLGYAAGIGGLALMEAKLEQKYQQRGLPELYE